MIVQGMILVDTEYLYTYVSSGARGGDLGEFDRTGMPKAFTDVA